MPQVQAPVPTPSWAEASDALVSQPTPSQIASGFVLNQRPTPNTTNWILRQLSRGYRYLAQGVNAVLVGANQEVALRLLGGGAWSFNATTGALTWSEAAYIAAPGLADSVNTIAAGSVTLSAGQVAYVAANVPFSTTGDTTSGSATVANLAFESGVVVGATVSGAGIPAGATVAAVSTSDNSITLSAPATATATGVALVFATSGALTVQAADNSSFAPSSNTVMIARCVTGSASNSVIVGVNSGQFLLRHAESRRLLTNGFVSTMSVVAGQDIGASVPVYISPGNTGVGSFDATRTAGAAYPLDASASSNIVRSSFAGITTAAVTAGNRVEVVATGRVAFVPGGLVTGSPFWASPTVGQTIQNAPPSLPGQYVVPVGIALSPTSLLVNNATPAAQVPAVVSYKAVLDLGFYWNTGNSAAGTAYPTQDVIVYNGTTATVNHKHTHTHAGSVVGVSVHANNAASSSTFVTLYKNSSATAFANANLLNSGLTDGQTTFTKGQYPFSPGDTLSASISATSANQNIALRVYVTVEYTP